MAAKKGQYQIPFDPKGNQQDYPSDTGWNPRIPPTWVDNFVFVDTLTYFHYTQGRSSIGFTMKRTDGTTVNVFISDFHQMLPHLSRGQITGRFTFVKKGSNYGCMFLGPVEDDIQWRITYDY